MLIDVSESIQLLRSEDDHVHADDDTEGGDEVEQIHPEPDVLDWSWRVFLLVLAHLLQLDGNSQESREDREHRARWERHREEQDPAHLHEKLVVLGDQEWRHGSHLSLLLSLVVLRLVSFTLVARVIGREFAEVLEDLLLVRLEYLGFHCWCAVGDQVHNDLLEHKD